MSARTLPNGDIELSFCAVCWEPFPCKSGCKITVLMPRQAGWLTNIRAAEEGLGKNDTEKA